MQKLILIGLCGYAEGETFKLRFNLESCNLTRCGSTSESSSQKCLRNLRIL